MPDAEAMHLLLVEEHIAVPVANLTELDVSGGPVRRAGKVGLQIDPQVIADIAGEDEPRPADQEFVIGPDRTVPRVVRHARLRLGHVVVAELGIAAERVVIEPLLVLGRLRFLLLPLLLASLQAGLAFSNASLGAVHSMAHSLGGYKDLPHGECNALLLPHVIDYNFLRVPERFRRIADALGTPFLRRERKLENGKERNYFSDVNQKSGVE